MAFWGTVLSVLMGGLITWFVSRWYYVKAAKELKTEVSELQKLSTITLRALEDAGLCRLNRDKEGKIIGLVITLHPKNAIHGTTSSEATLTVSKM